MRRAGETGPRRPRGDEATGRSRTERDLDESLALFPLALDAGRMGTWQWEVASGRVIWSPGLEAIHGLAPGAFGGTFAAFQADIHPDDRERVLQTIARTLEHGEDHHVEYRIVRPDGRTRWLEGRGKLFRDASGAPLRMIGVCSDVTERKEAEAALRAKEAELDLVARTTPLILTHCSRDQRYLFANPAAAALFGLTPEQMIGKPIRDILGDAAYAIIEPRVEQVLRGEPVEYEEKIRYAGVGERWVRVSYLPERDERGAVVGWIASIVDVTERKRIEEALRESEGLLSAVLQHSPLGVGLIDLEGRLVVGNAIVRSFLPERIPSRDPERIGRWCPQAEDGRPLAPRDWPAARALRGEVVTPGVEFLHETGDGRKVWTRIAAAPVRDAKERITGAVVVVQDIDASKRAADTLRIRARQQQAAAHLGELALRERDLGRVLERATATVAETLEIEYTKVLELLPDGRELLLRAGVGWKAGMVGRATVGTQRRSQAGYTLLSDTPVVVADLRAEKRFEGPSLLLEHGVVSGMSCIIRGADGKPWGVLGAHSRHRIVFTPDDVSFLAAVASTLGAAILRERAEAALAESDRRKDLFLATLAHELRNPLAPLRNGLELMRLAPGDARTLADARSMMERQLGQMVRLLDDLFDLSRISCGKVTLQKERVELAAALRQAVETSRPVIEQAGHELSLVLPAEPLPVFGDRVRLAQVFSNLLNNAAKFTARGGHIALTVARRGDEAMVSVRDDGVGIRPDMLARVFDMFTQVATDATDQAQGGLGIGLSLVKSLVEMHEGSVEARSAGPGSGSEFVVRLPLVALAAGEPEPVEVTPVRPGVRRRILVVDDNRDAAASLALLLRMSGNETRIAHDGLEALAAAAGFRPAVILLDIGMPRLGGYETARRIKEEAWGRDVVLVALTRSRPGRGQAALHGGRVRPPSRQAGRA